MVRRHISPFHQIPQSTRCRHFEHVKMTQGQAQMICMSSYPKPAHRIFHSAPSSSQVTPASLAGTSGCACVGSLRVPRLEEARRFVRPRFLRLLLPTRFNCRGGKELLISRKRCGRSLPELASIEKIGKVRCGLRVGPARASTPHRLPEDTAV